VKQINHATIRGILALIAVYHVLAGVAATFFTVQAALLASWMYGVDIVMDGQTELLVRYLGAFAIPFGVMAAMAALDPVRNKTFIYGAVVYFGVRAFDRILFASLFAEHQVGVVPNWWRILVILAFAVGLLVFVPRVSKSD